MHVGDPRASLLRQIEGVLQPCHVREAPCARFPLRHAVLERSPYFCARQIHHEQRVAEGLHVNELTLRDRARFDAGSHAAAVLQADGCAVLLGFPQVGVGDQVRQVRFALTDIGPVAVQAHLGFADDGLAKAVHGNRERP